MGVVGQGGMSGPAGPSGDAGPAGAAGTSVTATGIDAGDSNCAFGGSAFTSASGNTYACNGSNGAGIGGIFAAVQNSGLSVLGTANWRSVPGVQVSVTVAADGGTAELSADGSITGIGASGLSFCGFAFVVDGTLQGDSSWGDRLLGCGTGGGSPQLPFWCSWSMRRTVSLSGGPHTIGVSQTGWQPGYGCQTLSSDFSATKLSVLLH